MPMSAPTSISARSRGLSSVNIEALVAVADGNFQYVRFLLDELAAGKRKIDDFGTLPIGLHALYRSSSTASHIASLIHGVPVISHCLDG
jgi:hypothetical protein